MAMIVRVFRDDVEEPLLNLPEDEYLDVENLVLSFWRVSYSSSLEFRLHNEYLLCFFQDMPVNIPQSYMDQMIVIGKKEYYLVGDKLPAKVDWANKFEILFDDDEYYDAHP
jgi:hypothetical protein